MSLLATLPAFCPSAEAHVLYGRPTLATFVRGADAIVLAEITAEATPWVAQDQSGRCDALRARVVETLTPGALAGDVEFFLHAEGDPRFKVGDRVFLFLERSDGRPEFAPMKERFPWYSAQGPGQEWRADGASADARRAVVRSWLAAQDTQAVREVILAQLSSADAGLRQDAIFELVGARSGAGFFSSAEDVAPFVALLDGDTLTPSQARALRSLLAPYRRLGPGGAVGSRPLPPS